jgi:replicative DNA helicase
VQAEVRIPLPSNSEAEKSVLGSMLISQEAAALAVESLGTNDFHSPAHRLIYSAIRTVMQRGQPLDMIMLQDELRDEGKLIDAGGTTALIELTDFVPSAAAVEHYIGIVKEKSIRRQLIYAAQAIRDTALDEERQIDAVISHCAESILEIGNRADSTRITPWTELLSTAFEEIKAANERSGAIVGPRFGLNHLDWLIGGLKPGLIYVGARPSQGKTSLLTQLVIQNPKVPVAFFSLEMTKEQLAERVIVQSSRVDSSHIRMGPLSAQDWQDVSDACNRLYPLVVFIHDKSLDVTQLRARSARLKLSANIGMILVDYVGLIDVTHRTGSRQEDVAGLSRGLKALARDLNVPVIAAVQLSRASEQERDGKPKLRHLRDSGAQEADADQVILIHNPDSGIDDDKATDNAEAIADAELILAKNRFGPKGAMACHWHKTTMTFAGKWEV